MSDLFRIMWAPFLACLVLVGIHGYLGLHILQRGVIFVDLALAQFAAFGATVAVLLGHELGEPFSFVLSLLFTFLGAAILAGTRLRHLNVPQEAFIGVAWAVASSAAIVVLHSAPHGAEHMEEMLVGSILWVSPAEVGKAAAIYAVVGVFHWLCRRIFLRISFDLDGALGAGVRVRWWDFLFYASFGLVVASSVQIAGVLLVFCFLIVPSIFSAILGGSIGRRLCWAWGFGWAVSMMGCLLSYRLDLPTGATVVCAFGLALLLVVLVRLAVPRKDRVARFGSNG